ncbi:MAG: polymerase, sigma-24 subunit, subfamily [Frankiales bacterium]|nr:polymerase, sigma-24 subunit, subfamily [Frankiales bacterium]
MVSEDFASFVQRHGDQFLRYAVLLLGDREDAQDAVQAALERTYRRWDQVSTQEPAGYVRTALLNQARDRHRRRLVRLLALPRQFERTSNSEDGLDDRYDLIRATRQLPPRQRAVLLLKYWMDLPDAAIAKELGCSVGTVKSQASRGLDRLRALLREES